MWSFRNVKYADLQLNKYILLSILKTTVLLNIFENLDTFFK